MPFDQTISYQIKADAKNGWRQVLVDTNIENAGDDAISGFTAYYENHDGTWRSETTYYIEATKTTNLPDIVDAFVVECVDYIYKLDGNGDAQDGEYTYDGGVGLYFYSEADALKEAERKARNDESEAYMVGTIEGSTNAI